MNRFTIDTDFISFAGKKENIDLLLNVLIVFTLDNEFRICLDSSNIAFDKYIHVSENNERLRFWFNCLFDNSQNRRYIEYIKVNKNNCSNEKKLYIEICKNSCSIRKKIIVNNKQAYLQFMKKLSKNQIELIDGFEAKRILNSQIIQITTGNNSPNIVGDGNTINK